MDVAQLYLKHHQHCGLRVFLGVLNLQESYVLFSEGNFE